MLRYVVMMILPSPATAPATSPLYLSFASAISWKIPNLPKSKRIILFFFLASSLCETFFLAIKQCVTCFLLKPTHALSGEGTPKYFVTKYFWCVCLGTTGVLSHDNSPHPQLDYFLSMENQVCGKINYRPAGANQPKQIEKSQIYLWVLAQIIFL